MVTAYLVCLVLGGVLVGLSAFGGLGKDFDKPDLDAPDVAAEIAVAGPAREDTDARRPSRGPRWSPLASVRFWTFGGCFFGLTGVALSLFTTLGELAVALTSAAAGLSVGLSAAWAMRALRAPVGAVPGADALVGEIGALLHPLAPGRTSKARLEGHSGRELLVTLAPGGRLLPAGARVLVLAFSHGRAQVEAAEALLLCDAPALANAPEHDRANP
jgi:hypothetical protein